MMALPFDSGCNNSFHMTLYSLLYVIIHAHVVIMLLHHYHGEGRVTRIHFISLVLLFFMMNICRH